MTAITFPNSPVSGDTHTAGNGIVDWQPNKNS